MDEKHIDVDSTLLHVRKFGLYCNTDRKPLRLSDRVVIQFAFREHHSVYSVGYTFQEAQSGRAVN